MSKFKALETRMDCLLELMVDGERRDFILLQSKEEAHELAEIINEASAQALSPSGE